MKLLLSLYLLFLSATALAQPRPTSVDEEPAAAKEQSSSSWAWIVPGILALGAGGYAWFVGEAAKRRVAQLDKYVRQISSRQKKAAGGMQSAVQAAPTAMPKDDRAVQALEKRVGSLEKELDELRAELGRRARAPQQQQPVQSQTPPQPARPQPAPKPQPKPAAQPLPSVMETVSKAAPPAGPQTKWAKYADAGDGFNAASLSDEQDGEKLFELSVDGMNAVFRVVSTRAAQQMALHDPTYYLAKACTYDTLPTPQSTITTESPGTLKLQGGKWVIQRPAKIRFS